MSSNGGYDRLSKRAKGIYVRSWWELAGRIAITVGMTIYAYMEEGAATVFEGFNFFKQFTLYHVIWLLWLWYMIAKLIPMTGLKAPGSTKYLGKQFIPSKAYQEYLELKKKYPEEKMSKDVIGHAAEDEMHKAYAKIQRFETEYKRERKKNWQGVLATTISWLALSGAIYGLYRMVKFVDNRLLFIFAMLFYISDLICILIWCPFRTFLVRTKCCTHCRIYNWDTIMLVTPILFIPGFYAYSLGAFALADLVVWEVSAIRHPERFCMITNQRLQCATCGGALGCEHLRPEEKIAAWKRKKAAAK